MSSFLEGLGRCDGIVKILKCCLKQELQICDGLVKTVQILIISGLKLIARGFFLTIGESKLYLRTPQKPTDCYP